MLTLATGISSNNSFDARSMRRRGFTLIEIMIVVFVIGMITAGAVLVFGGESRDTQLEQEAERVSTLFDYVREQAELQTRDYGFRATGNSYSFVVFDVLANQWRPVEEDDILREREIPAGIEARVFVEGRSIVLDEPRQLQNSMPQIMIFANGDLTSFEIQLSRAGTEDYARIYSDEQTVIHLLQPGQEEPPAPAPAARRL